MHPSPLPLQNPVITHLVLGMSVEEETPITSAQLAGHISELLFYGIYLVTWCFCANTLLFSGRGSRERWLRLHEIHWVTVGIALSLFFVCTFNVATGSVLLIHAFAVSQNPATDLFKVDWISTARVCRQTLLVSLSSTLNN